MTVLDEVKKFKCFWSFIFPNDARIYFLFFIFFLPRTGSRSDFVRNRIRKWCNVVNILIGGIRWEVCKYCNQFDHMDHETSTTHYF